MVTEEQADYQISCPLADPVDDGDGNVDGAATISTTTLVTTAA